MLGEWSDEQNGAAMNIFLVMWITVYMGLRRGRWFWG